MTDARQPEMATANISADSEVIDKRHTVSLWFYLLGALAFLGGCYLLFVEDGTQVRSLSPNVSPRTEKLENVPSKVARALTRDAITADTAIVVQPVMPMPTASANAGAGLPPAERAFSPEFLDGAWRDAEVAGIRRATFDRAFSANRTLDQSIIALSANQPEFDRTVGDYVSNIVNADRIAVGRARLEQQAPILDAIERKYGVDRHILLAIWGIESNFGLAKGDRSVIRSLATLASTDTRRSAFWRSELTAALTILEQDKIAPERLVGSWAGAMGHTQFMPSTYVKHSVDFDGDGSRDLWASVPDALASAANYLKASGWVAGRAWGREVILPSDFDFSLASPGAGRAMVAWRVLGLRAQAGSLPPDDGALWQVVAPSGAGGPAFLVSSNFDALLSYNRAYSYAIAVGALADKLAGAGGIQAAWPIGDVPMSRDQRIELQEILASLGFDTGGIDGILGTKTREAIRAFQKVKGLATDGHPSIVLLTRMRSERRL